MSEEWRIFRICDMWCALSAYCHINDKAYYASCEIDFNYKGQSPWGIEEISVEQYEKVIEWWQTRTDLESFEGEISRLTLIVLGGKMPSLPEEAK